MDWALKLKFPRKHLNIAFLISHYSCNTCWAFLASPVTNSTCGFHGGCLGGSWQRGTASQLALAQTREGAAHHPGRHDDPWPVTTTFLTGPSVTTRSHSPPAMPDSGPTAFANYWGNRTGMFKTPWAEAARGPPDGAVSVCRGPNG